MFDAQDAKFRSIRLRPKKADCAVCGDKPIVTQLVDYEAFCGSAASDKVGPGNLMRSLISWGQIQYVCFSRIVVFFGDKRPH